MPKQRAPDNALRFIQKCVRERKVLWTYHVNMRLRDRCISREEILDSVDEYQIIEEYPTDKYLPSYLVCCDLKGRIFHVLFAADVQDDNVRVITAYYPNRNDWEQDLRTRRQSP
jgi:hypothetical protein